MNSEELPSDYLGNLSYRLFRRTTNPQFLDEALDTSQEIFTYGDPRFKEFSNLFNQEAAQFGLDPFSDEQLKELFFQPDQQFVEQPNNVDSTDQPIFDPLSHRFSRRRFMQAAAILGLTAPIPLNTFQQQDNHGENNTSIPSVEQEVEEHHEDHEMSWLGYTVMTGMIANFAHIVGKAAKGGQFNGDTALRSLGLATICSKVLEKYGNEGDKAFGHHIWAETYNPVTMGLAALLPYLTNLTELAKIAPAVMIKEEIIKSTNPDITSEELAAMTPAEGNRIMLEGYMKDMPEASNVISDETDIAIQFGAKDFEDLTLDHISEFVQKGLESGDINEKTKITQKLEVLKASMENRISKMVGRGNSLGFLVAPFMTTYMSTQVGNQLGELIFQEVSKLEFIKTLQNNMEEAEGPMSEGELYLIEAMSSVNADNLVNGIDGYVGNILSYFANIAGVILAGDPPNFFAFAEAIKRGNLTKYFIDSTAWGTAESIAVGVYNSFKVSAKLLGRSVLSKDNVMECGLAFLNGIPAAFNNENGFFRKLFSQPDSGDLASQYFERFKLNTFTDSISNLLTEDSIIEYQITDLDVLTLQNLQASLMEHKYLFDSAPANSLSLEDLRLKFEECMLSQAVIDQYIQVLQKYKKCIPAESFSMEEVQALLNNAGNNIKEVDIYTPAFILKASTIALANTVKGYVNNLADVIPYNELLLTGKDQLKISRDTILDFNLIQEQISILLQNQDTDSVNSFFGQFKELDIITLQNLSYQLQELTQSEYGSHLSLSTLEILLKNPPYELSQVAINSYTEMLARVELQNRGQQRKSLRNRIEHSMHKIYNEFMLLNFEDHHNHDETFAERMRGETLSPAEVSKHFSNIVFGSGNINAFKFISELGLQIPEIHDNLNVTNVIDIDDHSRAIIDKAVASFAMGLEHIIDETNNQEVEEDVQKEKIYNLVNQIFTDAGTGLDLNKLQIDQKKAEQFIKDKMGYTISEAEAFSKYSHAAKEVQDALWTQIPHVAALVEGAKVALHALESGLRTAGMSQDNIDYIKLGFVTTLTAGVSAVADNVAAFLFSLGTMESIIEEFKTRNGISDERIASAKHQSFLLSLRTAIYAGMLLKPGNGPNFKVVKNKPNIKYSILNIEQAGTLAINNKYAQFVIQPNDMKTEDALDNKIKYLNQLGFNIDDTTKKKLGGNTDKSKLDKKIYLAQLAGQEVDDELIEQFKAEIEAEEQPAFFLLPQLQKLEKGRINVDPAPVEFAETKAMGWQWGSLPASMLGARGVSLWSNLKNLAAAEA